MSTRAYALSDGNSFYCSCERVFDARLAKVPVIVLSNNDGCAIARTPEAKALGIRMGEPFFILTGVRLRAALIRWNQVDFREGVIRVVRMKRKKKSKTPVIQEIPITPRLLTLLKAQEGRNKTFVFTYLASKTQRIARTDREKVKGERYPLTDQGFMSSWEDICWRQGIEDLRIHDLRKTAGTRMLRATGNIAVVSQFLGHTDIRMTMRYYAFLFTEDVQTAKTAMENRYYHGSQNTADAAAPLTKVSGCTCGASRSDFRPPKGQSPAPNQATVTIHAK